MGQTEIIQFLQSNKGKRFKTQDLADHFGVCRTSIYKSLMQLLRFGLVRSRYDTDIRPGTKALAIRWWYV